MNETQFEVPPADPGGRAKDDRLGPAKHCDGVIVIDYDLVAPNAHGLVVVALVQLAERRETRSPHPYLEVLVLAGIEHLPLLVPLRVAERTRGSEPERRRDNIVRVVRGLLIVLVLPGPHDALFAHGIIAQHLARAVQELGVVEGVVEHAVGDQPAGVNALARVRIPAERLALAVFELLRRAGLVHELLKVHTLEVSPVVLVEIRQPVVQEHATRELVGHAEGDRASEGRRIARGHAVLLHGPLRPCVRSRVELMEVVPRLVCRHVYRWLPWLELAAVGVVNRKFVHLFYRPVCDRANDRKEDADAHQQRQHRGMGQQRVPGL